METKCLKKALLKDHFCDLRFQKFTLTTIKGVNEVIEKVSVTHKSGGNVRVLSGGGFGSFCFTSPSDIELAVNEAKLASDLIEGKKKLKHVEVNIDTVKVKPRTDPRAVCIDEKKCLLEYYVGLFLKYKAITNVESEYYEQFTETLIMNNQGTEILQEELICGIKFKITSKKDDLTQVIGLSLGGSQEFEALLGQEEVITLKAKQAIDLLDAAPVLSGAYDVILDSEVSGLFIHEAFGHLSEADNLVGNKALMKTMTIGDEFASMGLNVIDDPTLTGYPGTYVYDHEGTKAKKTYLIRDGKLSGRLHSLESALELNEVPTGHARAKNFGHIPLVRMSNIYIEGGNDTLEDMITSIDNGLYLFGSAGGQTKGDTFTFAVQGAYKIINGKLAELVRDITLTGHIASTLKNIESIGNSVTFSKNGNCIKQMQLLIQSGKGGPPIKIKNIGIGGK